MKKKNRNKFVGFIKYISTIITWSLFIILVLIGIVFLIYIYDVNRSNNKGAIPMFSAYVIVSGSMEPNIRVYDVIVSRRTDPKKLKVDDVITFRSIDPKLNGIIITHRIVEVVDRENGEYRTMGDANNTVDESITSGGSILGKVAFRIPQLGRIQMFIATKGGWLIGILIPCLAIISYDIVKIIKLTKRKVISRKRRVIK